MVAELNTPEGYHNTDVGIIPVGWSVYSLSDFLKVRHGKSQHQVIAEDGEFPILGTGGQIGWASDFLYNKKSVLIGRKGTINKPQYIEEPFWTIDTLFYTEIFENADPKYIYYLFTTIDWYSYNEASGVPSLSASTIEKINVALPPIHEQQSISKALSNIDNLIESLEKYISKKKEIKLGTMQELITGKRRLPGFSRKLEKKKLGDIASMYSGGTPLSSNRHYYGGNIPWITSGDLNQGRINHVKGRITKEGFDNSSAKMIKRGTLLVALYGATAGVAAISNINASINQAVLAILPDNNNDSTYLYYKLTYLKEWIIKTYTQGGQPNLSGNIMKSIEIMLPELEEQLAVSRILMDMDIEIEELKQKLEKYKAIKQGMIQELLTGRTRIV